MLPTPFQSLIMIISAVSARSVRQPEPFPIFFSPSTPSPLPPRPACSWGGMFPCAGRSRRVARSLSKPGGKFNLKNTSQRRPDRISPVRKMRRNLLLEGGGKGEKKGEKIRSDIARPKNCADADRCLVIPKKILARPSTPPRGLARARARACAAATCVTRAYVRLRRIARKLENRQQDAITIIARDRLHRRRCRFTALCVYTFDAALKYGKLALARSFPRQIGERAHTRTPRNHSATRACRGCLAIKYLAQSGARKHAYRLAEWRRKREEGGEGRKEGRKSRGKASVKSRVGKIPSRVRPKFALQARYSSK